MNNIEHRLVDTAPPLPGQGRFVEGPCQLVGIASRRSILPEGTAESVNRHQEVLGQAVENTLPDCLVIQEPPLGYADADVNWKGDLFQYTTPLQGTLALST